MTSQTAISNPGPGDVNAVAVPDHLHAVTVTEVEHYTDSLFHFRVTRPASFRFRSGEFIMIGLMQDSGKPLLRAYSICSPAWDEELEFYSIKVPDGPLTSQLQHIKVGDTLVMGKKPVGTLVLDALRPGKRLYMLSTGTGLAPFASLTRDPETYEKFEDVILTHTCRHVDEFEYGLQLARQLSDDPLIGEIAAGRVRHYTSCTRDEHPTRGRITTLIESGQLFSDLGLPPLDPETDRVMICGSMAMIKDTAALCEAAGLEEGSNAAPADFVIERAFVG